MGQWGNLSTLGHYLCFQPALYTYLTELTSLDLALSGLSCPDTAKADLKYGFSPIFSNRENFI